MTQTVTVIHREHLLSLEILLTAEKIPRAPMRRDLQTYYEELILNHYERLACARLEQHRESVINFAREHGQQRVHSEKRPISKKKVKRVGFEDMLTGLFQIRAWLTANPEGNFPSKQARIQAAVDDFERFREK